MNTNWDVQGIDTRRGALRLDLRYEYIKQNRLRSGTHDIPADLESHEAGELVTRNRNLLATVDYAIDTQWAVSVTLPLVKRDHIHGHHDHNDDATAFEQWNFTRLSDARVVGRYQFDAAEAQAGNAGIQFGVKLPTGARHLANANGAVAERSLQPGSGSTDLIAGAYYAKPATLHGFGWFVQGGYQRAVATQAGYRPGDQLTLSAGMTYPVTQQVALLTQFNASHKARDTGANAEHDSSGGKNLHVSPGLSVALGKAVQAYGFVQLPLYQKVNGIQLVASRAWVGGASMQF